MMVVGIALFLIFMLPSEKYQVTPGRSTWADRHRTAQVPKLILLKF
jgi:hypothetical protein